jgi:hypothetical protein
LNGTNGHIYPLDNGGLLPPGAGDHAHHWLIAKQDGPSSEGTCKACGAQRDFVNGYTRSYVARYRRFLPPPADAGPAAPPG